MSGSPVATAHRLLTEAIDALTTAADTGATDTELLSVLTVCEGLTRRLDRLTVSTISTLQRRGAFAERGYKSTAGALTDLLGWERFEARRRVHAADSLCPRIGLDGTQLPPRLAATAAAFDTGRARLTRPYLVGSQPECGVRVRDARSAPRRRPVGSASERG